MSAKLQSCRFARYISSSFRTTHFINIVGWQIGGQEGMIAALLQIIATDSVDLYVFGSLKIISNDIELKF